MPLVKIDLNRGRSREVLEQIANHIHAAVVRVFGIDPADRFQVITQHEIGEIFAEDAGLGFSRSPDLLVIQIFTQRGRDTNQKQLLYQNIVAELTLVGIEPKDVFISYIENTAADWSFGFGKAQFVVGELAPYGQ